VRKDGLAKPEAADGYPPEGIHSRVKPAAFREGGQKVQGYE
jgi:hypothetical protein